MASTPTAARPGWVYLVGAGPGDPELITVRGAELVASADVVLHDELVDRAQLERATGEVRAVGKRGSAPEKKSAAQDAINQELVALATAGKSVVRLKGGDPFLFGRGAEEALALRAAGLPFEVVPGVPSPVGATAYAGVPLTHRELASSVTFVTAVTRDGASFDFGELASLRSTLCVFMGARRLDAICRALQNEAKRAPDTPAVVAQWISDPRQRVVEGTLQDIAGRAAAAGIGSPALLIAGEVASLRAQLRWFDAQPLFGKRVLVTRPVHQAGPTMRALRRHGAAPVSCPTIAIAPPPDEARVRDAARRLADYDLVAFTSDNGVRWLWRALDALGLDARAFGNAKVAAIGPATAAGLRRRGIIPDVVAETFVAEHLAEAILEVAPASARVLLPRALVAREVLPDTLRAAGMRVDVVPVYQTISAGPQLASVLPDIDVVLLTSSSTAKELCAALGDDAPAQLAHVTIASIGPITSDTARALGLEVAVTATVSTSGGLIDALEAHFNAS